MRPEQSADSTDDAMTVHTENVAVAAGRNQPAGHDDETRTEPEEPAEPPDGIEAAPRVGQDEEPVRLLRPDDADRFHTRWHEIQARFVDDPRDAVRDAGALLDEALASLTDAFNEHKRQDSGAQTEDLRLTLRRYRSVLNRLLDA